MRSFFPGRPYVGCDFREGPGVDRVEDVTDISLDDNSAGTVICLETFEHVFEVRRAFDEVFRILRPGGLFILTSPFNFRIHGYPDDYWRITPSCLRRMLAPYDGRVVGSQGHPSFPHTVMSVAIKCPAPTDFEARADRLIRAYRRMARAGRGVDPPAAEDPPRGGPDLSLQGRAELRLGLLPGRFRHRHQPARRVRRRGPDPDREQSPGQGGADGTAS